MKTSPRHSNSGIALIMVLIVTAVLGMLAAGFAYTMKVETQLARNATFDGEMEWMGRSGIELARYILAQEGLGPMGQVDCLNQRWAGGPGSDTNSPISVIPLENYQMGSGSFSLKIVDMDRKLNINTVPPDLLRSILTTSIGIDADWADTIAASVQDWRDPNDDRTPNGTESDDYLVNPNPGYPPYIAKDGNIDDMSELLMIRGVTPAIYWGPKFTSHWQPPRRRGTGPQEEQTYAVGLVDIFTALSGGKLNVNTASAQTLETIIPDPNMVQECIIRRRAGPDGAEGTEDDTPFRSPGEVGCAFMGGPMPPPGAAMPRPGIVNPPGAAPGMNPGMNPGMMPGMNPMMQIAQLFTVRSLIFEATVEARVGSRTRQYVALLRRNSPRDIQVLNMYWK